MQTPKDTLPVSLHAFLRDGDPYFSRMGYSCFQNSQRETLRKACFLFTLSDKSGLKHIHNVYHHWGADLTPAPELPMKGASPPAIGPK